MTKSATGRNESSISSAQLHRIQFSKTMLEIWLANFMPSNKYRCANLLISKLSGKKETRKRTSNMTKCSTISPLKIMLTRTFVCALLADLATKQRTVVSQTFQEGKLRIRRTWRITLTQMLRLKSRTKESKRSWLVKRRKKKQREKLPQRRLSRERKTQNDFYLFIIFRF